jgi:glyoxylase-like metal-dependent hydrolase (beta-lactamase superfamily II)
MFEKRTGTWQYVVADPPTKKAIIIDSVLDYDPTTREISTTTADGLLALVAQNGYHIEKILETHAHADHLTAASYLQHRLSQLQGFNPPICIGKRIREVQDLFAAKYGIAIEDYEGVFDKLFDDDETFEIGNVKGTIMHLPGHTPDHIGYYISGNVFCGDSIFNTDIGSARCDFPGGSAKNLFASAQKLLQLPDEVKIWTGHDYPSCPARCDAVPWMTVGDHRKSNKHLSEGVKEEDFLKMREDRDAGLAAPKLLDPSLQINIRAGRLPRLSRGGQRLMHLPLRLQSEAW